MLHRLFLLLFAVLLAGCAQTALQEKDRLEGAARYAELATLMESRGAGTSARTADLVPLCVAYSKIKRYSKLFDCLDRLEASIRNGDLMDILGSGGLFEMKSDVTFLPPVLRAEALLELGDYEGAAAAASKANIPMPNANPMSYHSETNMRGRALAVLALANVMLGKTPEAHRNRDQLEAMSLGGFAGYGGRSLFKKQTLARISMALGQWDKALALLEDDSGAAILALANAIMGTTAPGENLYAFLELPKKYMHAKCLLKVGRTSEAKKELDALLASPQGRQNGELYWLMLFDRGVIAERESSSADAIRFWQEAVDIIEQQRASINTEASKIGFVGDKQAAYASLIRLLISTGDAATAFEYVERSKSRALVDMLAAKQDFAITAGDPARVKELLAKASHAEAEAIIQDANADKLSIRSAVVAARQQLGAESPELASLVSVSYLKAAEVQSLVPQDETLVEYYQNGDDLVVFLVTSKDLKVVQLETAGVHDTVRVLREAIEDVASDHYLASARKLYGQLIQPITGHLSGSKLVIVAHGPLHYLPFNVLHDGKAFVIERYSLRMLPSASMIKYVRSGRVDKPGEVLALGNPDLGDSRFDLANAQAEAIAVTKNRPQSRALLRKDANEAAFRSYGGSFRYVHFATHGMFNAAAPLKSALLLAKDSESDGLLTVDKLYSTKLDAELVTLSACETGLGKIASGDDVVGLSRGFLYAGSRSIVASLWKVDDLATSYLMTRFYDQLKAGDKREALRQAQRDTMKEFPHPFYWGAFQLTGSAN